MVFRVTKRQDQSTALQFGRSWFRQSTALIGATLLFCLAGVGAEAQERHYNHGSTGVEDGSTPNPTSGGVWSTDNDTELNWVASSGQGNNFAEDENSDFTNGDDVYFFSSGETLIEIEVDGAVQPDDITVVDGAFEFNDDDDAGGLAGSISAESLTVQAAGTLNLDTDLTVTETAELDGRMTIRQGSTLTIPETLNGNSNAVSVDTGGRLTLEGTVVGSVTVNTGGVLTLGDLGHVTRTLTFEGSTFTGSGHVGRLWVESDAIVTFGGSNAVVDRNVINVGALSLGQGAFSGRLLNQGMLTLIDDVAINNTDEFEVMDGQNGAAGTITTDGQSRVLSFTENFRNGGTLQGGGGTLTIEAAMLTLNANTSILGTVILSGAINNSSSLDLVHVPVLEGAFANTESGTATVSSDVDGNEQIFTNQGDLQVTGGDLTGLQRLANSGIFNVAAGRTLGATDIVHSNGTLTSVGTLTGAISTSATAQIQGVINGSLEITDGTTTITGALDISGSGSDDAITVGEDGELTIAESTTVTLEPTESLVNDGSLVLGSAVSGTADVVIQGNVVNSGEMSGEARITGDLTFTGDSDTEFTGTLLTVDGALVNDLDDSALLSDFDGITYGSLENSGTLTIDAAADPVTTAVTNLAGGTLTVNAAIAGPLTSRGTTTLNRNVGGQLQILAGITTTGANLPAGPILVGGAGAPQLNIGTDGTLHVNGGSLTASGTVRAAGQLQVSQNRTLTTSRLIVAGDNGSRVRGTVAGEVLVQPTGALELDGAIVTGQLVNNGRLTSANVTGQAVGLQGGLENDGVVLLNAAGQPAIITGTLLNQENGTAEIIGNVIADGTVPAIVTNLGELNLTGDVEGRVVNRDLLELSGAITGSLQNFGTATVDGEIGVDAVNSGTLNLAADVGQEIRNIGTGATLNIIGDSQAANLVNTGTVNVTTGQSLDLTSGALTNVSGATLNVAGTIESTGAAGPLTVQNADGGRLTVADSGTVTGSLTNDGTAAIAGTVTGAVENSATGDLELQNGAQLDATLNNSGETTVVAGATATVTGGTVNRNDLDVRGTLVSDVINMAGSTLEMTGGTITGAVNNQANADIISSGTINGDVLNAGTFTVDLYTLVRGDFTNDELLTQSRDGSELTVTDTFTNNGTIDATGSWTFTISADNYVNNGTLTGNVLIDSDIGNAGQIIYDRDTTLLGNLTNRANAFVRVYATVTGTGDNIVTNRGTFDISGDGALVNVDTIINHDRFLIAEGGRVQANEFVNVGGSLTNDGRIEADVTNRAGAELISTRAIIGDLSNAGDASLAGRVQGALTTTALGETTVSGDLTVTGPLQNDGTMLVVADATLTSTQTIVNGTDGDLTARGAIVGDVLNNGAAQIFGGLTGDLTNAGDALLSGAVTGALVNNGADATTAIRIRDSLEVGSASNESGQLIVGAGRSLTVADRFQNIGDGVLTIAGEVSLQSDQTLLNSSTRGMTMLAGSTLNGNLQNDSTADLAGRINGSVLNRGEAEAAGRITGDLVNEGAVFETAGNLVVEGEIINRRAPASGAPSVPGGPQAGPGDPAMLLVNANTTLTARGGVTNDQYSRVVVNGTLNSRVTNNGVFILSNLLNGSLINNGDAELEGEITGDVTFREGSMALTGDLTVGGTFDAFQNFTIGRDRTLTAGLYNNRADQRLTVNGTLAGATNNFGIINAGNGASIEDLTNEGTVFVDGALNIAGSLTNNSRVSLQNDATDDVLTVNGDVSGDGVYALDLDLNGNGGAGASDLIVVRGGAVTGSILLTFDSGDIESPSDDSRRILVFDLDENEDNNFTFAAEGLPDTSERVVYALVQDSDTGNLFVTDAINPALGALAGNLALTQSLIGSVVNRPTSPFVPGLATDAGDQKCGAGAWARAVAGHASATGRTVSGEVTADSQIEANYHGLQFGGDLACFENSFHGWNVAVGVLGGVNDGSTTQPVFLNNTVGSGGGNGDLFSINSGDFRQIYGGVYATASQDRLSVDLQLRRERTTFTIDNNPIGTNDGLELENPEFDSNATTLSGSLSYAYQLPREGWMFVPTAGFAFSNLSADEIRFTSKDKMQIQDSKNRVGFIGGTLSKTFINPTKNSAVYAFGTATVYKDFASDTKSIYTMVDKDGSVSRTEELTSSNLGTYGELSLGANYLKVLDTGRAGAPRQFNASIRVDGRAGDVLDSYGVTAQVRFQF